MKTQPKVTLLACTPNPEALITAAAKLCYSPSNIEDILSNLDEAAIDKFVNLLADLGHESPFEHATFTFGIEGVSRAFSHQLVRHRLASYSQKSQRYVTEGSFDFIVPPSIEDLGLENEYASIMAENQRAYDELFALLLIEKINSYIEKHNLLTDSEESVNVVEWFRKNHKSIYTAFEKSAAEDARFVLPNACETKIVVTMNIRSLWNFFGHRCCERAQWEIRYIANEMLQICKQTAPLLFKNAGAHCVNGICPENAMQCEKYKGSIPTQAEVKELIKQYYV